MEKLTSTLSPLDLNCESVKFPVKLQVTLPVLSMFDTLMLIVIGVVLMRVAGDSTCPLMIRVSNTLVMLMLTLFETVAAFSVSFAPKIIHSTPLKFFFGSILSC